jgi:hypothetical protein
LLIANVFENTQSGQTWARKVDVDWSRDRRGPLNFLGIRIAIAALTDGLPFAITRGDIKDMTSAYIAKAVRKVLAERGLPDTLVRVAVLPYAWEIILRKPTGTEEHVIVPVGPTALLHDTIRWSLATN